jgi:hypothetical protein
MVGKPNRNRKKVISKAGRLDWRVINLTNTVENANNRADVSRKTLPLII